MIRSDIPIHRSPWPQYVMWLLVVSAFVNAFIYTRAIANPMIMADNWLFVDTFLRHVIDGDGDFGDFLVKRAGLDHGLPHYKLMMLLNAKFFALDFSLEALAGVVFALLGWMVLYRMATSDAPLEQRQPAFFLAMAAMAAVQLSLNAYYTYLYSMVTLGFLDYLLAFLMFFTAWQALQGGRLWPFVVWTLIYAIAADTSATLTGTALIAALLLAGWKLQKIRRAMLLMALIVAALIVARLVYAQFGEIRGSTLAVFNVPLSERLTALALQTGEAWRWVIGPAASGVAWRGALQYFFGPNWQASQIVLGLAITAAHGWFWWCALRYRPRAASFAAVCLMLLFYGYVAGVLYGRVFVRGSEYFDQDRYVSLYQIGILALLMMAAARILDRPVAPRLHRVAVAVSVLLIVVQIPLTLHSRAQVPGIVGYYRVMATQYGVVARDPAPDRICVDQLTICGLPQERVRVIEMLRRHQLNLFSPRFAARHPELVAAAAPLPVAPPD